MKLEKESNLRQDMDFNLAHKITDHIEEHNHVTGESMPVTRERLIQEQEKDPELSVIRRRALTESQIQDVPKGYFMQSEILMKKWRPPLKKIQHEMLKVLSAIVKYTYFQY